MNLVWGSGFACKDLLDTKRLGAGRRRNSAKIFGIVVVRSLLKKHPLAHYLPSRQKLASAIFIRFWNVLRRGHRCPSNCAH